MDASTAEPSAAPTVTRHLRITGRVQGVGYRYHLAQEARRLCVVGWVRNRSDGSVEALVHGPQVDVETLITWAHHGPPLARVELSGKLTVMPATIPIATFCRTVSASSGLSSPFRKASRTQDQVQAPMLFSVQRKAGVLA